MRECRNRRNDGGNAWHVLMDDGRRMRLRFGAQLRLGDDEVTVIDIREVTP